MKLEEAFFQCIASLMKMASNSGVFIITKVDVSYYSI